MLSKSDLSHAYQIFEIKPVYFYNNSMNVFRPCMINKGFMSTFQLRFTGGGGGGGGLLLD